MNPKVIVAILLLLVIGGAGWYFTQHTPEQPASVVNTPLAVPAPQPVDREEPQSAAVPTQPQKPLVTAPATLDNSDVQVRTAATDIAPELAQWVAPKEQVRKWTALVDEIADGKLPLKNRPIDYPQAGFAVKHDGDKLFLGRENYDRSALLIKTITAIPPARLAQYYHAWHPLFDKAYAELGDKGSFDQRLRDAIKRILAVKSLATPPELVRPSVYYKYADPRLEDASDIEKLMWRLGPENTQRIQNYLQQLQREL